MVAWLVDKRTKTTFPEATAAAAAAVGIFHEKLNRGENRKIFKSRANSFSLREIAKFRRKIPHTQSSNIFVGRNFQIVT